MHCGQRDYILAGLGHIDKRPVVFDFPGHGVLVFKLTEEAAHQGHSGGVEVPGSRGGWWDKVVESEADAERGRGCHYVDRGVPESCKKGLQPLSPRDPSVQPQAWDGALEEDVGVLVDAYYGQQVLHRGI